MAASLFLMAAYVLAMIYVPVLILQLTALAAVLGALSLLLLWIGYTALTAPPSPEASTTELGDLQAETICPEVGHPKSFAGPRFSQIVDVEIGEGTIVRDHVNLYKCKIGKNCKIESFVYMEEGVIVGDNCKIKPHVFIPTGVIIEDAVFVGPNVTFTNDMYPSAKGDWKLLKTFVGRGASIGADSVILPGISIGEGALIGAGSVVTTNVPENAMVAGNPARPLPK